MAKRKAGRAAGKPRAFDWKEVSRRPAPLVLGFGTGKGNLLGQVTAHSYYEVEYHRRSRAGMYIEMKFVLERGGAIFTIGALSQTANMLVAAAYLVSSIQDLCIDNDIVTGRYKPPKKGRN